MSNEKLIVQDITKSFDGKVVLKELSFSAESGIIGILAPSGTGKTTLLRILMGLEKKDGGEIRWEGCETPTWSAVFQEHRLLEYLSGKENLKFALGEDYQEEKVQKMLEALGLLDVQDQKAETYSGGMKRRLVLARALLKSADALALDEPFTGLDEENMQKAIQQIRMASGGKWIFLVCHEESVLNYMADQILRL